MGRVLCIDVWRMENWKMLVFFWIFCPSRTFTCWGYVQFFDICSVYLYPSINITRIKMFNLKVTNSKENTTKSKKEWNTLAYNPVPYVVYSFQDKSSSTNKRKRKTTKIETASSIKNCCFIFYLPFFQSDIMKKYIDTTNIMFLSQPTSSVTFRLHNAWLSHGIITYFDPH